MQLCGFVSKVKRVENSIDHWEALFIAGAFFSLVMLEGALGIYRHGARSNKHWWIDFVSLAQLALFIKPIMFFLATMVLWTVAPQWQGAWADLPFLARVPDSLFTR